MADDNEPLLPTTGSAAAAGVGTRRISQQHVELNENLASAVFSSKRKRPGAAGEELAGAGAGAVGESAADASLESSRLKRRNGAGALEGGGGGMEKGTWGGKVLAGGPGVSSSPVEGAQTRKRKSLEKLAAVAGAAAAEDDGGSVSPSREVVKISTNSSSSKKRKPAVGDEAVYGMKDGPEPSDEGRVSQGLRLRFTRSGNSLAAKKVTCEEDTRTGSAGEHTEGPNIRSRGSFDVANRSGEGEPWTMPAQVRDQSHPSAGDGHGTPANASNAKVSEKSPLTRELYRIPSHAGWFSWSKIHNIERRSLGEFFDGKSLSKTPKIYKEYRDFIINKYREKEQRLLTFTEVRRMLIGDVNALRRVFDFLDHWGLINHQVGTESNQEASPTPITDDGVPSGVRVALGPVVSPVLQSESSLGVSSPLTGLQLHALPSYRNVFAPVIPAGEAEKIPLKFNCSSCGADCSKIRFHCQDEIQAGLDLCPTCYKSGKFGPMRVPKDFVRINGESDSTGDRWTTKETLSLLEAIGRFGDNWNQVADYVGTKSRGECVKQFIRLPFGDRFLNDAGADSPAFMDGERMLVDCDEEPRVSDEVHETEGNIKSNGGKHSAVRGCPVSGKSGRRSTKQELTPLQDVNNPLLGQVALMSAMVGSRVAAAAAQAAIITIAEDDPALANHSIMNRYSTPGAQQNFDSRSKEPSRPETPAQGVLAQEVEREADGGPSAVQLQVGIATGLAAAAVNAKLLADQEEREMELLMTDIIENQMKALYAKLEHFDELEMLLERERIQIEQARQTQFLQQIQFTESRLHLTRHG
ncbi:hypothetical protein AXG93_1865s1280 [Marchantia polymorpha subsp. ruderalis]|uniref:Uncharacterized protein n=1 Tax=Marchantia polymorpha subsp. ruderalis TaxID=1480154 RepID=A0A176WGB8_MARPO|nr:hypothetical protein AXG93_1865s1280 [Marchantia polymorpha subsp. ruderalis]